MDKSYLYELTRPSVYAGDSAAPLSCHDRAMSRITALVMPVVDAGKSLLDGIHKGFHKEKKVQKEISAKVALPPVKRLDATLMLPDLKAFLLGKQNRDILQHASTIIEDNYTYHHSLKSEIADRIRNCVTTNNIVGLKDLAFELFGSAPSYKTLNNAPILLALFCDEEATLFDMGAVMLNLLDEVHTAYIEDHHLIQSHEDQLDRADRGEGDGEVVSWPDYTQRDGEELVKFTHGGGYRFIQSFLEGLEKGYPLTRYGRGLQVSPVQGGKSSMAAYYAKSHAFAHFDTPTIFEAEIPAKYLMSAANPYEAGLKKEALGHLRNITITKLDVQNRELLNSVGYPSWRKIKSLYSKGQTDRIFRTMHRLNVFTLEFGCAQSASNDKKEQKEIKRR